MWRLSFICWLDCNHLRVVEADAENPKTLGQLRHMAATSTFPEYSRHPQTTGGGSHPSAHARICLVSLGKRSSMYCSEPSCWLKLSRCPCWRARLSGSLMFTRYSQYFLALVSLQFICQFCQTLVCFTWTVSLWYFVVSVSDLKESNAWRYVPLIGYPRGVQ